MSRKIAIVGAGDMAGSLLVLDSLGRWGIIRALDERGVDCANVIRSRSRHHHWKSSTVLRALATSNRSDRILRIQRRVTHDEVTQNMRQEIKAT